MKSLYRSFFVLMFLIMTNVQAQDSSLSFPEKNFATPEAALHYFVESLTKNDLMSALQAFAINQQAEAFDFVATSEHLGVIQMALTLSPTEYPMYIELNRLGLISRYGQQIKLFSYSLLLQPTESLEEFDPYKTILIQDEPSLVSEFVNAVNPENLSSLTISKVFRMVATAEKLVDIWQQQAILMGADEMTELVVLYELGGNYYLGGARVSRYGERWKLDGLYSPLAGTDVGGNAELTTLEGFETFIEELSDSDKWKLEEIKN